MEKIQEQLLKWLSRSLKPDAAEWVEEKNFKIRKEKDFKKLQTAFSMVSRMIPSLPLELDEEDNKIAQKLRPDWRPQNLDAQQAARIYLILSFSSATPRDFLNAVEKLLIGSDMNEQIAIFAGLPVYPFPKTLLPVAYEGTRCNITAVFDTITLDNPYPRDYFSQEAFNRLVLKAAFMERPFMKIIGIPERSNYELAHLLLDLISERWSAGRTINPMLWKLIVPALNQDLFKKFQQKAEKQDSLAKAALALSFQESSSSPQEFKMEETPNWDKIQKDWENREQL